MTKRVKSASTNTPTYMYVDKSIVSYSLTKVNRFDEKERLFGLEQSKTDVMKGFNIGK